MRIFWCYIYDIYVCIYVYIIYMYIRTYRHAPYKKCKWGMPPALARGHAFLVVPPTLSVSLTRSTVDTSSGKDKLHWGHKFSASIYQVPVHSCASGELGLWSTRWSHHHVKKRYGGSSRLRRWEGDRVGMLHLKENVHCAPLILFPRS